VFASAVAFLLSELADFAVYTPLQSRSLCGAVLASSLIGLLPTVFSSCGWPSAASTSSPADPGQASWMVLLALPFIH